MIVLGSNIYQLIFTDDLYLYKADHGLKYKEGVIISPMKYELPQVTYTRSERADIAFTILKEGLKQLEYLLVDDSILINPFETQLYNHYRSVPALNIQLVAREQPSIVLDARKLYFSANSVYQLIHEQEQANKDSQEFVKDKYVKTRYTSKQFWFKIKRIIYDQEFSYKGVGLLEYYKNKHKLIATKEVYLETYDQTSVKTQFLLAELCDLQLFIDETDCTQYCQGMMQWNNILNCSQDFINYLKQYKLLIEGNHVVFPQQFLEPGTLVLANNTYKPLSTLIYPRTQSEYEHFYSEIFLRHQPAFNTNLGINNLIIISNRESQYEKDNFNKFTDQLGYFIKSRSYKINNPTIIDAKENLEEQITSLIQQDCYILFVGDAQFICKAIQSRNQLLGKAIPNQYIQLPISEFELNRLLGVMAANIGSTPWTIKEIDGNLGTYKRCAVMGIHENNDVYSSVITINKGMSKCVSKFGRLEECIKYQLGSFYATQKAFPEVLVLITIKQLDTKLVDQYIAALIALIQSQGQSNEQIVQPLVVQIVTTQNQQLRYFTYQENDFQPLFCRNPGVGQLAPLNDKNGVFSLHSKRGGQGCPTAYQIEILGCPQVMYKDVLQLYYQLIFLSYDLNNQTHLPAPLHYAIKLSQHTSIYTQEFIKSIQQGKLLYI